MYQSTQWVIPGKIDTPPPLPTEEVQKYLPFRRGGGGGDILLIIVSCTRKSEGAGQVKSGCFLE